MAVTPPRIVSYYTNLIDERIECLDNHLADDVILYWYGRTVKGKELVLSFLSDEIACSEHYITSAQAIPEIHYREVSSVSKACSTRPKEESCAPVTADCVGLLGSGVDSLPCEEDFPGRKHNESDLQPLDSSLVQNTPDLKMSERQKNALLHKPLKKKYLPNLRLSMLMGHDKFGFGERSFVEARGNVSFRVVKRYGVGRPWNRECILQLAYSCPTFDADPIARCQFSVIIYSDEMKCRRNLAAVFEQMNFD